MAISKDPPPGQPEECTVRETTSLTGQDAIAQCPAGMVCTSGGISLPVYGMVATESRLTEDGTGWYGAFRDGPSGGTGIVYARCVPAGEATASPSAP